MTKNNKNVCLSGQYYLKDGDRRLYKKKKITKMY